jgi:hypothetical protein
MPRAAWHWGSDTSVMNDPLGEPGRTPLYVGLLSAWGSVDGDYLFSPHFVGGFLNWGPPKDMLTKALEMGACFHSGPVLENMGRGLLS